MQVMDQKATQTISISSKPRERSPTNNVRNSALNNQGTGLNNTNER